jgi:hypothetical protein
MSDFTNEFDYLIKKGWWFSVTPKNNEWRCTIYRLKPDGNWHAQDTKQFKTIIKGMMWIEKYIDKKLNG